MLSFWLLFVVIVMSLIKKKGGMMLGSAYSIANVDKCSVLLSPSLPGPRTLLPVSLSRLQGLRRLAVHSTARPEFPTAALGVPSLR